MTSTRGVLALRPIAHDIDRSYTSAPGTSYLLPSDEVERERLALQHRVLKRAFDGQLVIPSVDLTHGGNILDSGTGSGIWNIDAAKTLPPSVELYGVDIESRLFPNSHRKNLHFSAHSVINLPREWTDMFTLVNQRLLMAALRQSEWLTALREIHRVLIPGGWVQLGEAASWKSGPVTERYKSLMKALFEEKGLLLDCTNHIPRILEEAGFVDIRVDIGKIPIGQWAGRDGIDARNNFVSVYRAMKAPVLNLGGLGIVNSETELDELTDAIGKEWDETPGTEMDFAYIYARKPVYP